MWRRRCERTVTALSGSRRQATTVKINKSERRAKATEQLHRDLLLSAGGPLLNSALCRCFRRYCSDQDGSIVDHGLSTCRQFAAVEVTTCNDAFPASRLVDRDSISVLSQVQYTAVVFWKRMDHLQSKMPTEAFLSGRARSRLWFAVDGPRGCYEGTRRRAGGVSVD